MCIIAIAMAMTARMGQLQLTTLQYCMSFLNVLPRYSVHNGRCMSSIVCYNDGQMFWVVLCLVIGVTETPQQIALLQWMTEERKWM